ncbi:DUF2975 domain-containing protein [Hymenobacter chitinivorans]|uniref:DUF2975 family protein n=1 Tax=Hymenobacter chitinivorans DSM 11115 TaxID=1121954 RepID=A0A2M9B9E3_9BACT|nr:DUF2975 domain-containing protein [Hymenobacter chitinivorans]PJJ54569.1 Protein of unknown function (DUF2975) [Hymenobacter chitinivorans DSM 11115]
MPATYTALPPFLRFVRVLAAAQYVLSAIGLLFYAWISISDLRPDSQIASYTLPSLTLEVQHPRQGQVHGATLDSLKTMPGTFRLVPKSQKLALVYVERSFGKRVALMILGVNNHSGKRGSVVLVLYSMLTGMLLYRILTDMSLASPFTEKNARRIRWLGLLMIGVDLYQYVAFRYMLSIVPHFRAPDLQGTVVQYLTLDPAEEIGAWKFGLVLLVIAAVYKRGVIMAQEAELTV